MEEINLDSLDMKPSSDFGGGFELLMNDKKKGDSKTVDVSISLEEELKELENVGHIPETKPFKLNIDRDIQIGRDTASMNTQTMNEGFRHINDIPLEEVSKQAEVKTKEELLREKFQYLRKLETLEGKGVTLSKRYTMDSSLEEMKGEYEHIISEKERKNSVQFAGKALVTLITGLEFLNSKMDPFDIKLDGWSEQINESIDEYDEIFGELHDKYKSKAKMSPELKLVFQLAASGMMIHVSNTMFKSSIPGMDDIMRQNPDLMQQFQKAAVSSMENSRPGLSNFMNEFSSRPDRVPPPQPRQREEMRGPDNINSILSGLNKKIDLSDKNESTISIDEVDLMSSFPEAKTKRKRRSDKNAIHIEV